MNKEEVWKKFCDINPNFLGKENVCLNPAKIKKLVETSFKFQFVRICVIVCNHDLTMVPIPQS